MPFDYSTYLNKALTQLDLGYPYVVRELFKDAKTKVYNWQLQRNLNEGDLSGLSPSAQEMLRKIESSYGSQYSDGSAYTGTSTSGSGSSPVTPQAIQYFDAPLAEKYGMSAATAYQEALANTAHQRQVADLKAAGLNPVLGISGSGAGGVYSAQVASSGYGSYGSGKSTSDLADLAGQLKYGLPTFLNGVTSLVTTLATGNGMAGFGAGMIAQNTASGILNLMQNFSK